MCHSLVIKNFNISRKPRQHVNQALLTELVTGAYIALYNGSPDFALRAIDAIHQRAQFELMPEVLLVRVFLIPFDAVKLSYLVKRRIFGVTGGLTLYKS